MKKDIVFVCSGNTCRSPIAEYIFRDLLIKNGISDYFNSVSAGLFTYNDLPATELAIESMKEIGIDISCHRSQPLTQSIIDRSYAIVCMTQEHRELVINRFLNIGTRCYMMSHPDVIDVHDPFGGSLDNYRQTRDIIQSNLNNIFNIFCKYDN